MNRAIPVKTIALVSMPRHIVQWQSQTLAMKLIQDFWISFSKEYSLSLINIEVEPAHLFQVESDLRKTQLIVFPWNGAVYMKPLRGELKIKTPALFYLAGEGSRGFAYYFGQINFFSSTDIFVPVSRAEQKTLQLCFPKAKSIVIPYPCLPKQERTVASEHKMFDQASRVLYVGRYSEQKNLHTFLWSIRILLDQNPKLNFRVDLYGYEDQLGSPNMRIKYSRYHQYLKTLTLELRLIPIIHWHGFVKNEILKGYIQATPHVLVSPSLYSEECFGLAPFDSLATGNPVVLTKWGGYRDFEHRFKNQIQFITVLESKKGPYLCPFELADQIKSQLTSFKTKDSPSYLRPRFYTEKAIQKKMMGVIRAISREKKRPFKLKKSKWIEDLHHQIHLLNPDPEKSLRTLQLKIFKNYEDPMLLKPFRIYGMTKRRKFITKKTSFWLPPWVQVRKNQVIVRDPHRGFFRKTYKQEGSLSDVTARNINGESTKLPNNLALWLFDRGYLFTNL